MDPGSWGLTYYVYEQGEQFLGAHYLRDDGLVDMMWCWVPGGRVTAPGTRLLECWFTPQYNFETGEYADPEDYTSFIGSDRPGDGTGRITFTSVTPERLAGTFSITMHVVDWPDWLGSPTITISDGEFDLPVVSSYYDRGEETGGGGGAAAAASRPWTFAAASRTAINDHGVVIGWARNARGERRAVRWTVGLDGTVTGPEELGTLAGSTHQWPAAINNHGVIVGYGETAGMWDRAGFIYDGTIRALTPFENSFDVQPFDINDQGVVVGASDMWSPPYSQWRGPVWLNPLDPAERPIELTGVNSRYNYGLWITNQGVIVGRSNSYGAEGTYRWQVGDDGTISNPEAFYHAYPRGVNDDLDVLASFSPVPAVRRGTTTTSLVPLTGHVAASANALNNPLPGEPLRIVGVSRPDTSTAAINRVVVWRVDAAGQLDGPSELGHPDGFDRADPMAINAHGWVAGIAWNGSTFFPFPSSAILWLPRSGGADYDIIMLGGLGQPAASYQAPGARDVVSAGRMRCRARPGRPDRCR
jgi:probable HAF family extracellular repeat protein